MIRVVAALCLVLAVAVPATEPSAGPVDWRDESIYFLMTDRFRNGDTANDLDDRPNQNDWWQGGDLQGVIDELPYIKSLGMTAIWITPVTAQTPGGYHGYWTLDLYRVDPHLGDFAKLKELVSKAHGLGLKVVLDVVINHVGYEHPWLTDAAHAGWFHEDCPINFASQKSIEDCWLAGLPDLNTENPAVRAYLTDWALWLIEQTDVDGFRLDTARHVPLGFISEWVAAIKRAHPNFWILGEIFTDVYRFQARYLAAGLDAVTDFETYDSVRQALGGPRPDLARLADPPALARTDLSGYEDERATFIDNHDVPRFVGSAQPDEGTKARLEQALAYLFTMPGVPVLYYGTEIALPGAKDPDNRRLMPWDDANADVRSFTTRVATLRRSNAVLRRGVYREISSSQTTLAYSRTLGADLAIVTMSGSDEPVDLRVEAPALESGQTLVPAIGEALAYALTKDGSLVVRLPAHGVEVWLSERTPATPDTSTLGIGALFVLGGIVAGIGAVLLGGLIRRV